MYQRAQYKLFLDGKPAKITKEKVDKLIAIGFLKPSEHAPTTGIEEGGPHDWNNEELP